MLFYPQSVRRMYSDHDPVTERIVRRLHLPKWSLKTASALEYRIMGVLAVAMSMIGLFVFIKLVMQKLQ